MGGEEFAADNDSSRCYKLGGRREARLRHEWKIRERLGYLTALDWQKKGEVESLRLGVCRVGRRVADGGWDGPCPSQRTVNDSSARAHSHAVNRMLLAVVCRC